MRISDWSSDVCSSDLDRPHVVQAHLVGEQDKAWSIICKCGAAMQRNARKTARTMTPSSSHLLAQVCTAELVTRSEEHTSELQSLMRISYAVFCLKRKTTQNQKHTRLNTQDRTTYRYEV